MVKARQKVGKRIWELDLLRALAVLGMLCFHWFYLLDFWDLKQTDLFIGRWEVFGNTIRETFFMVVGAGLVLSYQNSVKRNSSFLNYGLRTMKKGGLLLLLGGVITLWSFVFAPDQVIRFGVLSFIGTGMILLWPLVARWYLLAAFTLLILFIKQQWGSVWAHESLWAYILGFYPYYWPSLDYFPLVPWLASISLGGVLASFLFKDGARRYPFFPLPFFLKPLIWVGQQALFIYLLHIPFLVVIIWGFVKLKFY